jgi:hypothetical protein
MGIRADVGMLSNPIRTEALAVKEPAAKSAIASTKNFLILNHLLNGQFNTLSPVTGERAGVVGSDD